MTRAIRWQRECGTSALRAARKCNGSGWARHFLICARFHFTEAARLLKGGRP